MNFGTFSNPLTLPGAGVYSQGFADAGVCSSEGVCVLVSTCFWMGVFKIPEGKRDLSRQKDKQLLLMI